MDVVTVRREMTGEEPVRFAPDYDGEVASHLVDAALSRIDRELAQVILAGGGDGSLPADISRVHLRTMILHGIAEIFERNLTPLGLAVRERIT